MSRATVLPALLFLFLAATPGAPSAQDRAASGLDAYLAAVARAEASLDEACAALDPPPEGRVWLRLGPEGVEIAPADAAAAAAAAFWVDAALGAREAALTLYGAASGAGLAAAPVMIETRTDGRIAVHDGGALALGDPCAALRRLTAALGPGAGSADPFAAARRLAGGDDASAPRMILAIGGAADLSLDAAPPAGAVVRGPDGVTAEIEIDAAGARIAAVAGQGAAPGPAALRVYDPADPYRPILTADLTILPGAAPPQAPLDAVLTPGAAASGVLAPGGAERLTVSAPSGGRITLTSGVGADLVAVLRTRTGEILARDDDSGDGYGFSLSADLQPGEYILDIKHCCGGGGAFTVSTTRE